MSFAVLATLLGPTWQPTSAYTELSDTVVAEASEIVPAYESL